MGRIPLVRVLLVAKQGLREAIERNLKQAGYSVISLGSASVAARSLRRVNPDILVVHVEGLSRDELEPVTSVAAQSGIPILILFQTELHSLSDRVRLQIEAANAGLPAAAGPHAQPFAEAADEAGDVRQRKVGDLVVDFDSHLASVAGRPLALTPKEYELLCRFLSRPGKAWARQELLDLVWGYEYADLRLVTVHVGNLRKKLRQASDRGALGAPEIETVRNVGYRLVSPDIHGRVAAGGEGVGDTGSRLGGPLIPRGQIAPRRGRLPFVGRDREMAALDQAAAAALEGRAQVVLVVGEAGIGKTRLVDEFAGSAAGIGLATYWGTCRDLLPEAAYEPWVEVLAQLEREGNAGRPAEVFATETPADGTSAAHGHRTRMRLFDRLAEVLRARSERGPLCLVFEDLHWADTSTLLALRHLIGRLRNSPLMFILTYRDLEALQPEILADLVTEALRGEDGQILTLGPLNLNDVNTFVQFCGCDDRDPGLAEEMYEQTEGNPFFLTQLMRLVLLQEPSSRPAIAALGLGKQEGVRQVVLKRLARLSATCREALDAASVIGAGFRKALLAAVLGVAEEDLPVWMEEALDHHIVIPNHQTPDCYRFAHHAVREVIYQDLDADVRAALHVKVGMALEQVHAGELDVYAADLAHHFVLGECGGECVEKAVEYSVRAAVAAASRCAWEEASSHWLRSLSLREDLGAGPQERTWAMPAQAYEGLARAFEATGDMQRAIESYREAVRRVPASETVWQARLRREQVFCLDATGSRDEAAALLLEARAILGAPGAQRDAEWWQEWIDVQLERCLPPFYNADLDELQAVADELGKAVEIHATPQQHARLARLLWLTDLRRARFRPSDQTIILARRLADGYLAAGSLSDLSAAEGALGITLALSPLHRESAWQHLALHWELVKQSHDVTRQLRALWIVGMWHRLGRDVARTQANAAQSLVLIGDRRIARYGPRAQGNLSWVAWKEGDLQKAGELAAGALAALGEDFPRCPFEWQIRWTLLGLYVTGGEFAAASQQATAMLDPSQQKLPDDLEHLLRCLSAAGKATSPEVAEQLLTVAGIYGYL